MTDRPKDETAMVLSDERWTETVEKYRRVERLGSEIRVTKPGVFGDLPSVTRAMVTAGSQGVRIRIGGDTPGSGGTICLAAAEADLFAEIIHAEAAAYRERIQGDSEDPTAEAPGD
jgi:hypothetical protein